MAFVKTDGGRSSGVERQIVILVVVGSNPIGHPIQGWIIPDTYFTSPMANSGGSRYSQIEKHMP